MIINFKLLGKSMQLLDELNSVNVAKVADKFVDYSQQYKAFDLLEDFTTTGLLNEDYLFSSYLTKFGFKNLPQYIEDRLLKPSLIGEVSYYYKLFIAHQYIEKVNQLCIDDLFIQFDREFPFILEVGFKRLLDDFPFTSIDGLDFLNEKLNERINVEEPFDKNLLKKIILK